MYVFYKKLILKVLLFIFLNIFSEYSLYAFSGAYLLKNGDTVFGFIQYYTIKDDKETLIDIAIKYDLGYNEIVEANPSLDPWYPRKGKKVVIPTYWILPFIKNLSSLKIGKNLLIVNLAELRLYLLKKWSKYFMVITFPIGIGMEGFDTPIGIYKIIEKRKNPVWIVPKSIRKEDPNLPPIVPPGPNNPLGKYAIRLSKPSYLIHGTNKPLGIGRRVSHGCIRMYPKDIKKLYNFVEIGDKVIITYQPVKIGKKGKNLYIEVHKGYKKVNLIQEAINIILKQQGKKFLVKDFYEKIKQSKGLPLLFFSQSSH